MRGWTQWEMAEKLEMSVAGYRKMIAGMTDSIGLYTAYRASVVLNIPIPVLYGSKEDRDKLLNKIYNAPQATCEKINHYLEFDAKYRHAQIKNANGNVWIDVLVPVGYMEDGMQFDATNIEKAEIADCYDGRVSKGIKVTENSLLPVYGQGEIILLEEKMPRIGDITVSVYLKTRTLYIRKVELGDNGYELHPIHGRGKIICVEKKDRGNWYELGRVIGSTQPLPHVKR